MPLEMILTLREEGWPIEPGDIGENITTLDIPYDSFVVGKQYEIGAAKIQISKPCTPCRNLHVLQYVGDARIPAFIKTLLNRRGWYARVLQEGSIRKGDLISEIV